MLRRLMFVTGRAGWEQDWSKRLIKSGRMGASEQGKAIARAIVDAFGTRPRIHAYYDDKRQSVVHIASAPGVIGDDLTAYATIGVHEYSIGHEEGGLPLRIEMLGLCASTSEIFPNILASCAFNIINSQFTCHPGAVFPNVVTFYHPEGALKHVLFVPPFLWEDRVRTMTFDDKKVAWLLAVPISDAELEYARMHGHEALEDLLEQHDADIADLDRASVL